MTLVIQGADQLAELAKVLRQAGRKDLQQELGKAINRATKPLKDDIKESARDSLPRAGGLAKRAAAERLVTRKRTGRQIAGIRVTAPKSDLSLWHLNEGVVRHRKKGKPPAEWTQQPIRAGFWDRPTQAIAPEVRRDLEQAMVEITRKLDLR